MTLISIFFKLRLALEIYLERQKTKLDAKSRGAADVRLKAIVRKSGKETYYDTRHSFTPLKKLLDDSFYREWVAEWKNNTDT